MRIWLSIRPNRCQQPYHISVEHTGPKRPQAPPHRGGEGTRRVTMMTLLRTSGSNHTHCPHRRGGANQKDHRPHSTGGGGDEAKQDQTGKATNPCERWEPFRLHLYLGVSTKALSRRVRV